jgi:hypothetical protein
MPLSSASASAATTQQQQQQRKTHQHHAHAYIRHSTSLGTSIQGMGVLAKQNRMNR